MIDLFKRVKKAKKAEAAKTPAEMTPQELNEFTAAITLEEIAEARITCGMTSLAIAERIFELRQNGKA